MNSVPTTIFFDCNSVAQGWGDSDFRTELVKAFKRTYDANIVMFCITDEQRLKVGAGAALLKADDEDKQWVKDEMERLGKFSAYLKAAQAGLNVEFPDDLENSREYSLMELYQEAQTALETK